MKRAVDTNVLVRLLVIDDEDQTQRATEFISRDLVDVEITVLLETEWVLRSAYRLGRQDVCGLLRSILTHPHIRIAELERVVSALDLHDGGMDFADALHLLGTGGEGEFITFDRALAKKVEQLGVNVPVRLL